jgi:excisionase family DNA binding protein
MMDLGDTREAGEAQREWMSPADVAEWLGLGKTKVYEILYSKRLKSYKVGKRRLIRRSDLLEWLESQRYEPGEDW